MRALRNVIDNSLPFVGVAIILGAMIFLDSPWFQVAFVGLGIALIQLGVRKAAHQTLPDGRQFHALRTEVDQFIRLVRHLNKAGLALKKFDSPENRLAFKNVHVAMQEAVQSMVEVAGETNAEIAAEFSARGGITVGEPVEPRKDPVTVSEEPVVSKNR